MEPLKFFFDTYALVEITKANPNYNPYAGKVGIILTKLNLMELHYSLLREVGKEAADKAYEEFLPFIVEVTDEVIKVANEFKLHNSRLNLSYVDCIGYTIARITEIPFLTGDSQFEGIENVEFVR